MAHLPYADLGTTETRPLVERIVAERGSVLHIYQMLLHSPPLAEGWLGFLTQVRQRLALPGALRELAIMQVAHLNGAPYEAQQHTSFALKEGLTSAQLAALPAWHQAPTNLFTPLQRAALELTDTMTRQIQVPAARIDNLRALLPDPEVVELVATIAAYNMVSRFLEALHVQATDSR